MIIKEKETFKGPLFVVGMGRSGTKLLRTLLNNHSKISLPVTESQFIPDFINSYPTDQVESFQRYLDDFEKTLFYQRIKKRKNLNREDFLNYKAKGLPSEFIEMTLQYFSPDFCGFGNIHFIWGDKTPFYIWNIDLLRTLFPNSRVIHIIRDPRDVALSYHKTWGKSLFWAAEKWRRAMKLTEDKGYATESWYLEVQYENLLNETERVLKKICKFIELPFEKEMNSLSQPVERFGDARSKIIEKDNTKKYLRDLSAKQLKKIEKIVKPYLLKNRYQLEHPNVSYKPLHPVLVQSYRITDFFAFLYHHLTKEDGILGVWIILKLQLRKFITT